MMKKILVIDDEENFTKIVKMNLEQTGKYEVACENRGSAALARAKDFAPDLIFLDVMMPDIDGGTVAFQLKEARETKDIPIVFLTAVATKDEATSRGGTIGGHPFIPKPASAADLIKCIEKYSK
ncbi:MAG: response regulator [Candidatus Omnitrophica bacterium]|nr:response regulator [Candidatus Omnitrophota bacterium]